MINKEKTPPIILNTKSADGKLLKNYHHNSSEYADFK